MHSIEDALALILARATPRPPTDVPLAEALGLVVAEDVASDVNSPPHDKSMVDGYAVVAADLAGGRAELEVVERVTAGDVPHRAVTPGQATEIMTGAPIPEGAEAVVMRERVERLAEPRIRIDDPDFSPHQHIMPLGKSLRRGEVAVAAGSIVRPIEIGLLAEVGRARVGCVPRPRVGVLATGNELVPAAERPGAGMIRNSNGPLLVAGIERAGGTPVDLGIVGDETAALGARIAEGLACDVLLLSGGVSAGLLDLVPGALAAAGVEQVFHKVKLKPGKPLWFGVRPDDAAPRLVFGLPGNPVSTLVCFELFVRPALEGLAGRGARPRETISAELALEHTHWGGRPTYHPARLAWSDGRATVEPLPWHGSADLRSLAAANALARFPAGDKTHRRGDAVDVLPLE